MKFKKNQNSVKNVRTVYLPIQCGLRQFFKKSSNLFKRFFLKTWQPTFFSLQQLQISIGVEIYCHFRDFSYQKNGVQNTKKVETQSNPPDSRENCSNRISECTESGARLCAVCRGEQLVFFRTPLSTNQVHIRLPTDKNRYLQHITGRRERYLLFCRRVTGKNRYNRVIRFENPTDDDPTILFPVKLFLNAFLACLLMKIKTFPPPPVQVKAVERYVLFRQTPLKLLRIFRF